MALPSYRQQEESSPSNFPIILVLKSSGLYKDISEEIKSSDVIVQSIDQLEEASAHIKKYERGILLATLSEVTLIRPLTKFASRFSEAIEDGYVAIVLVADLKNSIIAMATKKLGCTSMFMDSTIKEIKLNLESQLIKVERNWNAVSLAKRYANTSQSETEPEPTLKSVRKRDVSKVISTASIDTPDDCWLIRKEADARKILGKWLIDLIGPGPSSGQWVRVPSATDTIISTWEWKPFHAGKDSLILEGVWKFTGNRPVFQNYCWRFASSAPDLAYYKDEKLIEHRFVQDLNGNLILPKNSQAALEKMQSIQATFEFEIHTSPNPKEGLNFIEVKPKAGGKPSKVSAQKETTEKRAAELRTLFNSVQSKPNPASKKSISKITSTKRRKSYATEAADLKSKIVIWTPGEKYRSESQVSGFDSKAVEMSVAIPQDISPEQLRKVLEISEVDRIYINLQLRRAGIFFVLPKQGLGIRNKDFTFKLPEDMFEVQRRSFLRMPIPEDRELTLSIGGLSRISGKESKRHIRELSAGGLSFFADPSEESIFQKNRILDNVSFQLNDLQIQCWVKVQWSKLSTLKNRKVLLVGVQFMGLSADETEKINLYVLQENYEYLKKYSVSND